MSIVSDIKSRLINWSTPVQLVLEPQEGYVMQQMGLDKMHTDYGTSGWVYLGDPNLLYSQSGMDTYLVSVHIYANSLSVLSSLYDIVRKAVGGIPLRGSSPYRFINYQVDTSKIGSIYGVLSFEATQFFNPL